VAVGWSFAGSQKGNLSALSLLGGGASECVYILGATACSQAITVTWVQLGSRNPRLLTSLLGFYASGQLKNFFSLSEYCRIVAP